MYEPSSVTPSPASLKPLNIQSASDVTGSEDRSESPFEIKLSPLVTKRMSLDAFGAASPSPPVDAVAPPTDIEELVEEDDDTEAVDVSRLGAGHIESDLSSLPESSSGQDLSEKPTQYFTPFSAGEVTEGLSLLTPASPFLPPDRRRHVSCPPFPGTQSLLQAHGDHTKALSYELGCARRLIKETEQELHDAKKRLEEAEKGEDREQAYLFRMTELEELLAERDQGR